MGRSKPNSWKKAANKDRNLRRNQLKISPSYQFSKDNWNLENKISAIVKHGKKVPNFIKQDAKFRVELAKERNEFLPYEKSGERGSYISNVAASTNDSFYYIHKQKKLENAQKMNSESIEVPKENVSEPSDWNCWGPPSPTPKPPNTCTALVVYEPKPTNEKNISDKNKRICYHKKLHYKCNYGNRFINYQLEYDKIWSLDQKYKKNDIY